LTTSRRHNVPMVFDNLSEKGWAHFDPPLTCETAK